MHLARRLAAEAGEDAVAYVALFGLRRTSRTTRRAAAGTTRRLVLEAFRGVELLLAGREYERVATVLTSDLFVDEGQVQLTSLVWGRKPLRILKNRTRQEQASEARSTGALRSDDFRRWLRG